MQKVVKKTKEIEETEYYCDICGKQFQHSVCFYSLHQCVICSKEVCSDCAVDNPMWDDYDNKQIICKYCYEVYKPFKDKLNELYKVYEIEKKKIWKELRKKSEEKYAERKSHGKYHQNKMTYRESGVDIEKEKQAIKGILSSIKFQRRGIGRHLGGHYAGMIEFGDYALVLCNDGVGSKVKIASELKIWDTIGIDCIAMNVNDAICVGAEPLAFVDYLAIDDPKPEITKELGKGMERGAELSNISIIGGETSSLPEIVNGFDLVGTCLAYVKKDDIITGEKISSGDIIIGLGSSGMHSNGYTLARKVIELSNLSFKDKFPNGLYPDKTIGEVLLTPTRIYVKEIVELLKKIKVHGLAHITGGGLRNLPRLNKNVKFVIEDPFEPQPIFTFLQKQGNIDDKEMYQTFNMGMGFAVIVSEKDVDNTFKILNKYDSVDAKVVGRID